MNFIELLKSTYASDSPEKLYMLHSNFCEMLFWIYRYTVYHALKLFHNFLPPPPPPKSFKIYKRNLDYIDATGKF